MKSQQKYPLVAASVFLWIGFVLAISFMEAPLKFRAPGITLALGLGIGHIVFAALNSIEWIFALAILSPFLFRQVRQVSTDQLVFLGVLLILTVQTVWLLPELDTRAEQIIQHRVVHCSYHHICYVAADVLKVACLTIVGVKQLVF